MSRYEDDDAYKTWKCTASDGCDASGAGFTGTLCSKKCGNWVCPFHFDEFIRYRGTCPMCPRCWFLGAKSGDVTFTPGDWIGKLIPGKCVIVTIFRGRKLEPEILCLALERLTNEEISTLTGRQRRCFGCQTFPTSATNKNDKRAWCPLSRKILYSLGVQELREHP